MTNEKIDLDPEINAISEVYGALRGLDSDSQARVLNYVAQKLNVPNAGGIPDATRSIQQQEEVPELRRKEKEEGSKADDDDELEGISPVAKKWMTRGGLSSAELSKIFSLGIDEIDLIAKTVPGTKKKERMHSVLLLKGVASYLGTGIARCTHEQSKEALLHYDAYDSSNFASHLRSMAGDISNSKEGYTLTPRGLASATEMVKGLINESKSA